MDAGGDSEIRPSGLVRRGPFARLWWASLISSFGDWVAFFATLSLAAEIGGPDRATVAILVPLVARVLPGLVLGAVAGVLADRMNRRFTMVVSDFGRAGLVLSLVFVESLPMLFGVSVALEMLTLLRQPAREASVPSLVTPETLVAANSLSLAAAYGTGPLGSLAFTLLAEASARFPLDVGLGTSVALAFLVDGVTFVASGLLVATIPIPSPQLSVERRARGRWDWRAPLRDIAEGVRFVTTTPSVRGVVVGMATALFGGGALFVLGQPFAGQVLGAGPPGYGIVVTALGVGVAIGMLGITVLGSPSVRRDLVFGLSLVVTGITIVLGGMANTVWGAAGWVLVVGIGTGAAYVMGFTHLHERVSDELRGRTFGALFTLVRGALLVSFALAGVAAVALHGVLPDPFSNGIRNVLVAGGLIVLLSGIGTLWGVREAFRRPVMTEETYRSLRDASDAFTSFRGKRRSNEDEA